MFRVQFLLFAVSAAEKYFGRIFRGFPLSETTRARQVENKVQMTRFCIRNIPIMFVEQFLLFAVSTGEKYFDRILTAFPSPKTTKVGKLENWAEMTQFCTRKIPTQFAVQFLSFLVSTTEERLNQILMSFLCPYTTRTGLKQGKFEMGPEWLSFARETNQFVWGATFIVSH